MNKIRKGLIAYICVLAVFTVYVLMDTFVISRVYSDVADTHDVASTIDDADGDASSIKRAEGSTDARDMQDAQDRSDAVTINTDSSPVDTYSDENVSIDLYKLREYDTTIHVADVRLSSPEYLRTALAYGQYGKNVKQDTSEMAEDNDAVLAINGDYYGTRERGYVIKNGTLYRDSAISGQEDLVIYGDGSYEIISEDEMSADELIAKGAMQTLSFGPALVEDGVIAVSENEEISGKSMASNPRTAIGILDEDHYLFVVSDGRTEDNAGLSLYELAEVMRELGVVMAYNLDGGGSSAMYFNGKIVNTPTGGRAGHGSGTERSVSDIVYIGR